MAMRATTRLVLATLLIVTAVGCNAVPPWQMRQAQLSALHQYRQNQALAGQLGQAQASANQLASELAIANQRVDNLNAERTALHDRYAHLLTTASNPLPNAANRRFQELAEKYPEFEFDPETGVSKFNADLLFALGSDSVRPEAAQLLQEFAGIINSAEARDFNILVVGHTDDLPIKQSGTRAKHQTNWELSAHRGTAVIHSLSKYGVAEKRMGVAGYSMYQPVAPNSNDNNRQMNRRVEIYVLAPDARVAAFDGDR